MSPRKWWKWLRDEQYRAVRRWHKDRGDQTLRLDYDLGPDDVVFDVGAYVGEFACELAIKTQAKVISFEPIQQFAEQAIARNAKHENVVVYRYGLAAQSHSARVVIDGLASGRQRQGETSEVVEFRGIVDEMNRLAPQGLALLKLNIEGDEYDLLDAIIEAGRLGSIRNLQVQFHLTTQGDRARYAAIADRLTGTHVLTWRYPFIWENWQLKI